VLSVALIPLYLAAAVALLVVLALVFVRLADGRYAEQLLGRGTRIRPVRRHMIRSYIRDLEKTNPVAARAYSKLERLSPEAALRHSEAALSVLSAEERRAYLDLVDERRQRPLNRAQRRRESPSSGESRRDRSY
jgi:hypothetical protein